MNSLNEHAQETRDIIFNQGLTVDYLKTIETIIVIVIGHLQ